MEEWYSPRPPLHDGAGLGAPGAAGPRGPRLKKKVLQQFVSRESMTPSPATSTSLGASGCDLRLSWTSADIARFDRRTEAALAEKGSERLSAVPVSNATSAASGDASPNVAAGKRRERDEVGELDSRPHMWLWKHAARVVQQNHNRGPLSPFRSNAPSLEEAQPWRPASGPQAGTSGSWHDGVRHVPGTSPRAGTDSLLMSPRARRAKVLEGVEKALPKVELLRTIGEGAYGTVLEGRMGSGKPSKVAVKVEPTRAERIAEELNVLRRSRGHSNVVGFLFGYHHPNGKTYIGMELCAGGDLFDLMATHLLYIDDAKRYFMEIARGLAFLHMHNIVHHDIKPENIGIDAKGHAKIMDFGLAVQLTPELHLNPRTDKLETTVSSGTLVYCAPEIFRRRSHGVETDWWSLAVLFHELAFQSLPWDLDSVANDSGETTRRIVHWPVEKPKSVPFAKWTHKGILAFQFIRDMLEKSPPKRIASMEQIKQHALFPPGSWDVQTEVPKRLQPPKEQ